MVGYIIGNGGGIADTFGFVVAYLYFGVVYSIGIPV
jgi:hypothetical protein